MIKFTRPEEKLIRDIKYAIDTGHNKVELMYTDYKLFKQSYKDQYGSDYTITSELEKSGWNVNVKGSTNIELILSPIFK